MNPLELRKIIQVGYRFDQPEAAPLLDHLGRTLEPVKQKYTATIAFWIPAPKPFQRSAGATKVASPHKHERQALQDGAIFEHVQDFEFPEEPTLTEMGRRLMPVWEALTAQSLNLELNSLPTDTTTRPVFQFECATKEKEECLPSTV